jgi:hypothetical protein
MADLFGSLDMYGQVDWPEINAAWGLALFCLFSLARKVDFEFQGYVNRCTEIVVDRRPSSPLLMIKLLTRVLAFLSLPLRYRLIPLGSFSKIEDLSNRTTLELFVPTPPSPLLLPTPLIFSSPPSSFAHQQSPPLPSFPQLSFSAATAPPTSRLVSGRTDGTSPPWSPTSTASASSSSTRIPRKKRGLPQEEEEGRSGISGDIGSFWDPSSGLFSPHFDPFVFHPLR